MSRAKMAEDPATAYARGIVSGAIPACQWMQRAAARHLADREQGPARGLAWAPLAVAEITAFFSGLRHSKGEWAGTPIRLEPWQQFLLGSILGWRIAATGRRRFRTAYVEVPRKNGKSTMAAGLGLYLAFLDGEPGAEVYAAATKRDQARIVWTEARRMVLRSPALAARVTPLVGNLHDEGTASKFEPLGADADNLDGLNVHAAIVDELHAHKTPALWGVLKTGTGARREPLMFAITTAGTNLATICYELRGYTESLLQGVIEDDLFFGAIWTLDPGDVWSDRATWAKANPNLGVSVKPEMLEDLAKQARVMPSALPTFLTKHLNVWVQSDIPWMPMDLWAAAGQQPIEWASFDGAEAVLALDLASKDDLAAAVLLFRRDHEGATGEREPHYYIQSRFFLPEESVRAGAHDVTAHYAGWATQGYLTLTPGPTIDFRVIRAAIRALAKRYYLREIPHDPYQATMLGTELTEEGLTMVEVPQLAKHLSAPMKELVTLVKQGRLHHDGNPILAWNVANVRVKEDVNENILPRKASRGRKIDGAAALIMAMSRAMQLRESVYTTRARTGGPSLTVL